jgi:hypothetical protein
MRHAFELARKAAWVDDGVRRESLQGRGEDLVPHGRGRVRQQHLPDTGGVQRETAADLAHDRHRRVPRDAVEVEGESAVADGEVNGGQGGAVEVLQERRRDVPEVRLHRRQQAQVPQSPSDHVAALTGAPKRAPVHQLADEAMRCGQRQARPLRDLRQRLRPVPGVEAAQD